MCSSTFISKTCLAFLFLLYFVGMDLLLYFRVQDYDVRPSTNDSRASPYRSPILCDLNPICTVTVKAMTLDHPNHYILSPLASLTDYLLGISRSWTWLTPNAISFSHVLVAVIGARYVTRSSLFHRRVGVVLFQVRAWLDNLDGHVARTRLNVKGERSDVGSIGYLVDGVCDGLGCIALTVAVFIFLKRNSNHRGGYERLPIRTISSSSLSPHSAVSSTSFWRSPLYNILMVGLHFCLTSIAWNRYISVYQDLLESDVSSMISRKDLYDRQTVVFRSSSFWTIALAWKIFNFHAMMDYMLLAIFLDRIWEYVRFAWWQLPTVLFLLILISELHYTYTYEKILSYLLEAGWCADGKKIGITEPRRVAATSLANRVADERNCILGTTVGYCIRFDDYTDETTKIKYMTEGILLRELMSDPLLTSYSVIILDEVHERTLLTDIIMGLLKKIIRKRKSLRIIVSSATVDAEELRDFFNVNTTKDSSKDSAVIMSVEGRLYPVDVFFLKEPVANYVNGVVDTVLKIHETEESGDILAFLTGLDEVDQAVSLLSEHAKLIKDDKQKLLPLPMYGSLPNTEQLKVFWRAAKDTRKVIVATNIAETSITIPNIVYVIDCGFVKIPWFEAETQTNSLVIVPVSKASANQRAGRAGRVRTGKAFRLYTEEAYAELFEATPPEMQRSDLAPAILQLKALGIDNVLRFNFPSAPPSKNLVTGLELLYALGAIDSNGDLTTPLGLTMAEMPLEPVLAKSLIASGEMGCSEEIATILAMLQVQNIFVQPGGGQAALKARIARRKFEVEEGDLLTLLNVYTAYEQNKTPAWCQKHFLNQKALRRAMEIRVQMHKMLKRLDIPLVSCNGSVQQILKCLAAGLFPKAAYLHYTGMYRTVRGNKDLYIHPNSCLYTLQQPQWLLFCEILQTNKTYMKDLTVIQPEMLLDGAPHFYERTSIESV